MSCGRPRYTSWVNRVNFERNAAVWSPDVVVYYEGINDNIYNSFPWLDGPPTVGYFDAKSLHSSVFIELLRYYVVDKAIRSIPDFEMRPLRSPAIFEENVRGIVEIARQRNASAVLATFAIALPTSDGSLLTRIRAEEPVMCHFWGNVPSTLAGASGRTIKVIEAPRGAASSLPLARVAEVDAARRGPTSGTSANLTDAGKRHPRPRRRLGRARHGLMRIPRSWPSRRTGVDNRRLRALQGADGQLPRACLKVLRENGAGLLRRAEWLSMYTFARFPRRRSEVPSPGGTPRHDGAAGALALFDEAATLRDVTHEGLARGLSLNARSLSEIRGLARELECRGALHPRAPIRGRQRSPRRVLRRHNGVDARPGHRTGPRSSCPPSAWTR